MRVDRIGTTSVSETIRKPPLAEAKTALGKKETFYRTRVSLLLPNFCEKLFPRAKFHWNRAIGCWVMAKKTIFKVAAVRHLEFWKCSYLVIWLSWISKFAVMFQILSKSMIFHGDMASKQFAIWRPSAMLNFWNLEFMSRDLYCHAILLPCAKFHWNRSIGRWVAAKKRFLKWQQLLNFLNFFNTVMFIFDHVTVIDYYRMCCCIQNFIEIRIFSRWNMPVSRFSRWRISAILNFKGPIMCSLKNPCRTSYRSSIETVDLSCLVIEKIPFYVRIMATDKQTEKRANGRTNGQTDGQNQCVKPLARWRERRLIIYRVGQKTGLFLRSDNFAMTNDRKACNTSNVSEFCPEWNA